MDGVGGIPPRGRDHPVRHERPGDTQLKGSDNRAEVRQKEAGTVNRPPEETIDLGAKAKSTPAESARAADLQSAPPTRQSQDKAEIVSATMPEGLKCQLDMKRLERAQKKVAEAAVGNPEGLLGAQGEGITHEKVSRLINE